MKTKPKLIIFEGIATSGKTTTIANLFAYLQKKGQTAFVSEEKTFIPIFDNKDPLKAFNFLHGVIKKLKNISADYIIVERLYLTHAFRTGSNLDTFSSLEKEIIEFSDPIIILLKMEDKDITERISLADKQRGDLWKHKKSGTLQERTTYYQKQQKYLKKLSNQASVWVVSIDTSSMNWTQILKKVLRILK